MQITIYIGRVNDSVLLRIVCFSKYCY